MKSGQTGAALRSLSMTFTPPSSSCSSMSIRVVFSLFHLHIYLVGHVSIKNMSKYSKVIQTWRSTLHGAAAASGRSAQSTGVYVTDPQDSPFHKLNTAIRKKTPW